MFQGPRAAPGQELVLRAPRSPEEARRRGPKARGWSLSFVVAASAHEASAWKGVFAHARLN